MFHENSLDIISHSKPILEKTSNAYDELRTSCITDLMKRPI